MLQRGAQLVGSTVGAAVKRVMPAQATDRGRTRRSRAAAKRFSSRNAGSRSRARSRNR